MNTRPAVGIWLTALSCLAIAGCGGSAPEIVPTQGKVTLDGGEWPKPGYINFTPLKPAEGLPSRPGWGKFDTDGVFTVTTRKPGDGLIPGTYRVIVECWEIEPSDTRPGLSYIAKRFSTPAPGGLEELVIKPGTRGPVVLNYDVASRASEGE